MQADGKILVGGDFFGANSIGGQPRNGIARLDATTGLADSFNPNANVGILSIAVQADGKILAGGGFTSIGGQPRNRIARLDATTGLADSFNPNANDNVNAIIVQTDGKILAGGDFTVIGGQPRNYIARLGATTGLADSFDPNANNEVFSIAVQADGKILAGGVFTSVGGQARNHIARMNRDGTLDSGFNPNANNNVNAIAVQADGKILVGGAFVGANSIGGQTRNRIVRLDASTGLADSFDPNANSFVYAIAVQADGKIITSGSFTTLASTGGAAVTRNRIAQLETDGRLDQTLNLNVPGGDFFASALQPDGKILIGGHFNTILGVTRNNIVRLNTDGTLDTAFKLNADDEVDVIVVQADGRILIGGYFAAITPTGAPTVMRNHIARVNSDGTLDTAFNPNANNAVFAIAIQADGKIVVAGLFAGANSVGGQARNYIARLDATTGLADSFDPNANNVVNAIGVQADGKIVVGGYFFAANSIGGQTRNYIARLDATTGLVDSFNPNATGLVSALAVQPDRKILVGGSFHGGNSIGGQTRNYIARLDPMTGGADSFDPNANSAVLCVAVQADNKVLAGGYFQGANSIGGQTRNYIARLDATTGAADSFDPSADNLVFGIALQADGKILATGGFRNIGGQTRTLIARLTNDTASPQNLAATQTAVTWTRGGASPQVTHATFEFSTDNVSYTSLGNGTPVGSNWILTGLSLPIGQNFYIRARGYYRSGYQNDWKASWNPCGMPLSHRRLHQRRSSPERSTAVREPSTSICRSRVTPVSNAAAAERPMITRLSLPSPAQLLSLAQPSLRALDQSATVAAAGPPLLLLTSLE